MIGRIILGVAAAAIASRLTREAPRRVFVSYDHSEDARYRYLMDAWNENPRFAFAFDRRSPTVPIESDEAAVVKSSLTRKLKESDVLLVLIGRKTADSKWVGWEIERALAADISIPLVGVKLGKYKAPSEMSRVGAIWVSRFSKDGIVDALNRAS